jgi:hypothetical protein
MIFNYLTKVNIFRVRQTPFGVAVFFLPFGSVTHHRIASNGIE